MQYQISYSNAYGETLFDSAVFQARPEAESHARLLRRLGFSGVRIIGTPK